MANSEKSLITQVQSTDVTVTRIEATGEWEVRVSCPSGDFDIEPDYLHEAARLLTWMDALNVREDL